MTKYYFNWNTDRWTTSPVDVAYRIPFKQTSKSNSTEPVTSAAQKAHGFQGALKSVISVFHKHSPQENAQDVSNPVNAASPAPGQQANEYVM